IIPAAAGLFSTTTRWPSASPSLSATKRAGISVGPPAPKPTTSRIGRVGYGSPALAAPASAASASSSSAQPSLVFRLRRALPHRPLPRLRGRDREGVHAKICASSPPPHPSPASGGGSRLSLRAA